MTWRLQSRLSARPNKAVRQASLFLSHASWLIHANSFSCLTNVISKQTEKWDKKQTYLYICLSLSFWQVTERRDVRWWSNSFFVAIIGWHQVGSCVWHAIWYRDGAVICTRLRDGLHQVFIFTGPPPQPANFRLATSSDDSSIRVPASEKETLMLHEFKHEK